MDRNNEKPSCGQGARNAAKPAQKGPPASIGAEEDTHNLNLYAGITLEAILEPSNLKEALKRVVANRGAPGVDGMEVGQLLDWIRSHPGQLTKAIKEGTYRPFPVKRVSIPKDEPGKFRDLGIPTVIDRLVQQATAQVLDWAYDRDFSDRSFGFRRNMRAHHALRVITAEADQGYRWAVDMDLAKFFDTVNHSRLIRKLSLKIKDGRVISLIHKMLRSGVQINGEIKLTEIGLMQGGPLSPLLANIYLDELDKELEKRGHHFARYADDLICICKSRRAAERTLASLTRFVQEKMLLKVNQEKSHVAYISSPQTKFLGYGFYYSRTKRELRLTIHKKSKQKLKDTIRKLLSRSPKTSIENVKQLLAQKLRGWMNYFQLADAQKWTREIDQWIRRRIRQLLWKTWKKVRTRIKALIKLGADPARAYYWGCTRKGYWRISNSHILKTTLTTDFLKQRGWSWLGCFRG